MSLMGDNCEHGYGRIELRLMRFITKLIPIHSMQGKSLSLIVKYQNVEPSQCHTMKKKNSNLAQKSNYISIGGK